MVLLWVRAIDILYFTVLFYARLKVEVAALTSVFARVFKALLFETEAKDEMEKGSWCCADGDYTEVYFNAAFFTDWTYHQIETKYLCRETCNMKKHVNLKMHEFH